MGENSTIHTFACRTSGKLGRTRPRIASNTRAQKQPTSCDQGAGLESTRSEEAARLNKGELQVREVGQVGVHLWGQ